MLGAHALLYCGLTGVRDPNAVSVFCVSLCPNRGCRYRTCSYTKGISTTDIINSISRRFSDVPAVSNAEQGKGSGTGAAGSK